MEHTLDDRLLARYRAAADEEDCAFDTLEHAFEEGDRAALHAGAARWREATMRRADAAEHLAVMLDR